VTTIVSDPETPNLDTHERRIARRLSRLFRIERIGGFDRRPAATVRRLIARRGALIERLIAIERQRYSQEYSLKHSAALQQAMTDLSAEVRQAQEQAAARAERLRLELRLRRGAGLPTSMRSTASGRLIGRG
jgi:hypothetical protein